MIIQNQSFLQDGPIPFQQIADILGRLKALNIGAYSIFLGQVRADVLEEKKVKFIEYSSYPEMVEAEMKKILEHCFSLFSDIEFVHVVHSTGIVKARELSLLVIVGCRHRKDSFKAVETIVELIKKSLPVWKKEYYNDDSYIWTQNKI